MSILYCVISLGATPLAKHASCIGNFTEISEAILAKIDPDQAPKMTLRSQQEEYLFHYLSRDDLIFLCITEGGLEEDQYRAQIFLFLEEVKLRFLRQFPTVSKRRDAPGSAVVIPLAMNSEFGPVIAAEMRKRNQVLSGQDADSRISRMRAEVAQVKDVMVSNIDALVERGERMELLVDKTEALSTESVAFRRSARNVQRNMWWKNVRMKIILGLVIAVIVYVVLAASCGGMGLPKCVGHHSGNGTAPY